MKDTFAEIIARLEALTEPSRDLDAEIAIALGEGLKHHPYVAGWLMVGDDLMTRMRAEYYTASVDDAMSLIPEGWHTNDAHQSTDGLWQWTLRSKRASTPAAFSAGYGSSAARAITAACLRIKTHPATPQQG